MNKTDWRERLREESDNDFDVTGKFVGTSNNTEDVIKLVENLIKEAEERGYGKGRLDALNIVDEWCEDNNEAGDKGLWKHLMNAPETSEYVKSIREQARREVVEEIILKWLTVIMEDKEIEAYRKWLMTKLRDKYLNS